MVRSWGSSYIGDTGIRGVGPVRGAAAAHRRGGAGLPGVGEGVELNKRPTEMGSGCLVREYKKRPSFSSTKADIGSVAHPMAFHRNKVNVDEQGKKPRGEPERIMSAHIVLFPRQAHGTSNKNLQQNISHPWVSAVQGIAINRHSRALGATWSIPQMTVCSVKISPKKTPPPKKYRPSKTLSIGTNQDSDTSGGGDFRGIQIQVEWRSRRDRGLRHHRDPGFGMNPPPKA